MKANELMLGDYVSHFNEGKNCVVTELRGRKVAVSYTDDNGNTKYSELLPEMAFEPIHLTTEILEKNGFVENKYGEMILDEELGTSEIYLVLEPNYDKEYYWWKVNNELITKIKSIHELQHVLRLCNLDKWIEL